MKIVFMGNPDFAVPSLNTLVKTKHDIVCVVTNPAKPSGRGRKPTYSPVYTSALLHQLKIMSLVDLHSDETSTLLKKLEADIFVVVAYRILPEKIIRIPKIACINLHASLLPRYRGAAPIQWALINGDNETGLSTFLIQPKVDAGKILLQKKVAILEEDNYGTLSDRLSNLGAELLVKTIDQIETNTICTTDQNLSKVTQAPKILPHQLVIDWSKSAVEIHNLIRGLAPYPAARTKLNGKILKIFKTQIIHRNETESCGMIIDPINFIIQTGSEQLQIKEMQLEGKKMMKATDFLRGYKLNHNQALG